MYAHSFLDLLKEAVARYQAGRIQESLVLARLLLAHAPDNHFVLNTLGLCHGRCEDHTRAAELLRRAVLLRDDFLEGHINLANASHRGGRFGDAVTSYRRALALDPGNDIATGMLPNSFQCAVFTEWERESDFSAEEIVLYQHHAGLGDNLLYSTLPALFSARGQKVYVSDMNRVRNPEIAQLVWGCNPYVRGSSPARPNAGMAVIADRFAKMTHIANWLTRVEVTHGFPATNDLPVIHYEPKRHPGLGGRILLDLNSATVRYSQDELRRYVAFLALKYQYRVADMVQLRFSNPSISSENSLIDGIAVHQVTSIFELCDLLYSCAVFITVHSGANSLAAAIKRDNPSPVIHAAVDRNHYNEKCYIWRNVDYTIVESLSGKEMAAT